MNDSTEPGAMKRQRFFEAAEPLFARFGFLKTTIDDICKASGASKRTFYQLFANKSDFFIRMVFDLGEKQIEKHRADLAALPTAAAKLKAFLNGYVELWREHPVMNEIYVQPEIMAEIRGVMDTFRSSPLYLVLHEILQEGMENGEFAGIDPERAIWFIYGLLDSVYYLLPEVFGQPGGLEDPQLSEQMRRFIVRGLGGTEP